MMKTVSQEGKKRLAIAIIFLLMGGIIGASIGAITAAKLTADWGYDRAIHFLEIKGYELEINEIEFNQAMNKYKDYIAIKYPRKKNRR